jgi:hypothetical protein
MITLPVQARSGVRWVTTCKAWVTIVFALFCSLFLLHFATALQYVMLYQYKKQVHKDATFLQRKEKKHDHDNKQGS